MAELYGFQIDVTGNAVKQLEEINGKIGNLNQSSTGAMEVFKGFGAIEGLKKVAEWAKEAADFVMDVGKRAETTRLSFEVMLGSREKANQMVSSLRAWESKTSFTISEVSEAARMLMTYGVAGKDVLKDLKMLADASGGVNERFQRLTYSFGQTAAMGRLNGIELKEMVMAGFNPLMEISKRTGESMESLKEKMAKGLITFQDVTEAYKMATSEGGRFYGMMNRQSQTVTGLESTFHSAKESAAIAVFERASPIIKEFYKDAINATNQLKDFLEIKQSEKLGDTNAEMNVYIELLKNSNIPLSQRKEIIATLNTEYKDYLSSEITDQTNLNELNRIQSDSNKLISEKIELMIRSEKIADALKAKQEAEKEVMDIASINERAKTGEFKFADYWRYVKQGVFGGLQGQSMLSKARSMLRGDEEKNAMDTYLQAQKVYDDLMNGNTNMTDKIRAAKDLWKSDSTGNVDPNLINHPENNPMKMGGGLGEARTINMNFNQPIMQINAQSVDTRDMEDYSEKTVDFLTETIKNISYPHGGM